MTARRNLNPADLTALEDLVDRVGLTHVVEALSKISDAKADHIGATWQGDRHDNGERAWAKVATLLHQFAGGAACSRVSK